jgi:hypothetical protein
MLALSGPYSAVVHPIYNSPFLLKAKTYGQIIPISIVLKIVIGYPELFKIKSLWLSQHDTIMLSNGVVTMFRLQRSCSKMFTTLYS